jgi:hypothetical protein
VYAEGIPVEYGGKGLLGEYNTSVWDNMLQVRSCSYERYVACMVRAECLASLIVTCHSA